MGGKTDCNEGWGWSNEDEEVACDSPYALPNKFWLTSESARIFVAAFIIAGEIETGF